MASAVAAPESSAQAPRDGADETVGHCHRRTSNGPSGIHHSPLSGRRNLRPQLAGRQLTNVRRQLEDVIVGIAEVQRERVAVIRVSEGHTVLSKALLGGLEIVHDERDVPEPGRLGLTGGRLSLRLEQSELQPRLAKKDGLVILGRLIQLRQPKHVSVPRDRACWEAARVKGFGGPPCGGARSRRVTLSET